MWEYNFNNSIYETDIQQAVSVQLPWEKLCNKSLLITGASGMIASVIIDILMYRNLHYDQQVHITALSRNEKKARARFVRYWDSEYFRYVSCDLSEIGSFMDNRELIKTADYILHAASNTHPVAYSTDPVGTITTNIFGTYNLLKYASGYHCSRFLLFSSVEIYGENRGDVERFNEGYLGYIDCNTLRSGYPEGKRLSESMCNAFAAKSGQDFVIGRFSRVYGPTMLEDDSKAIAQFIRKASADEDVVLKSEGNQLYSYTYVVDAAVAAFYLLLKGESGKAYNVADESSDITLKELAETLSEIVGSKVVFELPEAAEKAGYSSATKATLDGSKLRGLGWIAKTPIKEGLVKTIKLIGDRYEYSGVTGRRSGSNL